MRFLKLFFLLIISVTGIQAQISVIPTVTHLSSPTAPNMGAVTLSVTGGSSPYSYTWTPGSLSTKDISSLAFQTYAVSIKDNAVATKTATYSVGYKVAWGEHYGTVSKYDTLQNTGAYGWAQAISKNTLLKSTDGWVEYILKDLNQYKQIGFLDSISIVKGNNADVDYGFYFEQGTQRIFRIVNGVTAVALNSPPEGTVLRVQRVGNVISLKINGVTNYSVTSAVDAAKSWKIKALVNTLNTGSLINVGCSFSNQSNLVFPGYGGVGAMVTHVTNPSGNDGSLKVTPALAGSYTYTWQPGSVALSSMMSKPLGTYTVSMADSLNNLVKLVYTIGHKVKWEQFYGAAQKHDTLINIGPYSWAQAISKNIIPGSTDGWLEYVLRDKDKGKQVGFLDSVSATKGNWADMDYGFYYEGSNQRLHRVIKGVTTFLCHPAEGAILRIERIGSVINFKINGALTYSVINSTDVSKNWYVKGLTFTSGSSLMNVGMSTSACSLTANAGISQTITCTSPTVSLTGSSNTSGVIYSWSPAGSSPTSSITSVTSPGIYTLQVTDAASGCTVTSTTTVTMNTTPPPLSTAAIPTASLMAYWPFSGNAQDVSGNGNHGTVSSAGLTVDRFGNPNKAYYFNGTSSRIDVPHSPTVDMDNAQDYTIAFWMKSQSTNSDASPISKHASDGSWNGYIFAGNVTDMGYCYGTGKFTFYAAAGADEDACADNLISSNMTDWYFVTGQYKSATNQVFIYVNGILQSDVGAVSGDLHTLTQLTFGAASDGVGGFYNGYLDDIRFYKRLLTQDEINALYNEPNPVSVLTCASPSITLKGFSPTSGVTYLWSPGGATTSSITVTTAGTYTLKVTNPENGCSTTNAIAIIGNSVLPNISTGLNQAITCTSPTATLMGSSSTSGVLYSWSPGGSTPFSSVTTATNPGTYALKVTDPSNGCSNQATVIVTFSNNLVTPVISYTGSPFAAIISTPQSVTITGATNGAFTAIPVGLNINSATGAIIPSLSASGVYTITYSSPEETNKACKYLVTTGVLIGTACEFTLVPSSEIRVCEGEVVSLSAASNKDFQYLWEPSTGLSCTTCANPYFSASPEVTLYTVHAYPDGYGSLACGVKTVSISIIPDCNTIIGCCFSNYGAVVYVADQNTHINVYCNLVNELGQFPNGSIKKGEFVNLGKINVKLDWIHNAKNNLYIVPQGESNFFGWNQNITGNSNTHFNRINLTGNGIKTTWIDAYAHNDLNLNSNELFVRNYTFFIKNPAAAVTNTGGGFVSTLTNGYLSRAMNTSSIYLYPMGSRASVSVPFRYRPVEMSQSTNADELSVNFMNEPPAVTDLAFTSVGSLLAKAPNVNSINTLYYHKIKQTTAGPASTLTINSFFPPLEGSYQSLAEWEKDPSQINYWWGATPGASVSVVPNAGGLIYASTSGSHTFDGTPFTLARSGVYVGTSDFGGTSGTGGSGTTITITTPGTPGGGTGGGLGTPSSVGSTGPGNTIVTPPVVAVDYVIHVTPANDCALPGQIKFTVNPDGSIPKSSILYGLQGSNTYLGTLSEDVYTIDNINSGLILHSTPKSILKNCINSVTVATSDGADYILNYTLNPTESITVYIPPTPVSLTLDQFMLYDISNTVVYASPVNLVQGNNTLSPALGAGTYHFTFSINSEPVTGQIIIK